MATADVSPDVSQIGEAAGLVWNALNANGPMTAKKLEKETGQAHDLVMQAIGWLAREDKLDIEGDGKNVQLALK